MKKSAYGFGLACLIGSAVIAGDGTWTNPLGGLWNDAGNWAGGNVAADGGLAAFEAAGGTVPVVNNITGLTLSGLAFNAVPGNAAAWRFAGPEIALSGTPAVSVAAGRAEFNGPVRASAALVKTGGGTLFFEGGLVSSAAVTLQGGVMEVRSGRELGSGNFYWEGGTVRVVPGQPGLQESIINNNGINVGYYGTNSLVTLDLRMADIAVCDQNTYPQNIQFIYRGRWYVPADGVYSFAKDFDDSGYLALDNCVLINNGTWNQLVVVRDVPVRQGWHDVEIRVAQGSGGVGPQTGRFQYGIMYDPTNGDFSSAPAMANARGFVDTGDGLSLRTDVLTCIPSLTFLTGNATLDASAMPGDYTPALLRGLQAAPGAVGVPTLTVAGGDGRLIIGNWTGYGYPSLHAVFNTDAVAPGGVLFGGKVALYRLPSSSPWTILPHTDLLIGTAGIIGTGPLTLTNHSVRIISEDAIGGPYPITVQGDGNSVFFDPTENVNGAWGNNLTLTLAHNVLLQGQRSAAVFTGRGVCYYDGVISGAGSLLKNESSTAHLRATNTFVGPVEISGGRLNVYAPTAGAAANPVTLTGGGTLSFAAAVPEAYVRALGGNTGTVDIPAGQTLTLDSLTMATLTVSGAGALCISNILPSTRLNIQGSVRLEILDSVTIPNITLTADGAMLTVTGSGALGLVSGAGALVKRGPGTITFTGAAAFDGNVIIEEGTLALAIPDVTTMFAHTAFWLDATKDASLDRYRNTNSSDADKDIVSTWLDWRGNGRQAQVENYSGAQNYDRPYLMPAECNGLPVISCGPFNDPPPAGNIHEYRRMVFNGLNCSRALMVFGSQDGGGHILGQTGNTDFMRGGTNVANFPRTASDPIWNTATFPVRLNGLPVDGRATGLSGGYQIVNVGFPSAHSINTIGMMNSWQNAGGQRYGEILFFTNTVTDAESRILEAYLGSKWDLPASGSPSPFTVAAGATLLVTGGMQIDSLHGAGTVVKTGTGALRIGGGGGFTGTIDVQGGTLAPIPLPEPPSAEALPTANMLFWLDACEPGRITIGAFPDQVFQWIDRRPGINRFAYGYYDGTQWWERPWRIQTPAPRGGGPLTWVDFAPNTAVDPSDRGHKYMKLAVDINPVGYVQDAPGSQGGYGNVRTGFVVLDSLRGGGTPVSGNNNTCTRDNPGIASSPVWGGGTSQNVLNGQTRLDGIHINGRQTGLNGAVQVLSFTTTGDTRIENLAFSKLGIERLGEVILFNTVLSADTRRAYEAYLLSKWKGISGQGYRHPGDRIVNTVNIASGVTLDLTPFTAGEIGAVNGPGAVRTSDFAALPALNGLDALDVLAGDIAFDISAQSATPSISVTGALTVPPAGTLTLNFIGRVTPGSIPLFTYGTLTGSGFNGWTLALAGDVPRGALVRIRQTPAATYADVIANGTLLLIR